MRASSNSSTRSTSWATWMLTLSSKFYYSSKRKTKRLTRSCYSQATFSRTDMTQTSTSLRQGEASTNNCQTISIRANHSISWREAWTPWNKSTCRAQKATWTHASSLASVSWTQGPKKTRTNYIITTFQKCRWHNSHPTCKTQNLRGTTTNRSSRSLTILWY